jgi:hypothetical protein
MAGEYTYNTTNYTFNTAVYTFNSIATEQLDQASDYTGNPGDQPVGSFSTTTYIAQSLTQGITGPITKVTLSLKKVLAPNRNYTITIYDDDSGKPGSALSDATTFNADSTLTSSYDWYNFTISNCSSIPATTVVWIVITSSVDTTNYIRWQRDRDDSYAGGGAYRSADFSTWTAINDQLFKTYVTA